MLRRGSARGVTLIELLVGLAVLTILLTAGLPSYSAWIHNWRIRVAAESMLNGLQLARSEAVRLNTTVAFVLGPDSGWVVEVVNPPATIQSRSSAQGSPNVQVTTTPAAATRVTFNSLGRVETNADGSASLASILVDVPSTVLPASVSRELQVTISMAGSIRMCDPNVTDSGDPRFCI
jgi:type IV fimbrial biogenesis protein FimT